MQSFIFRTTFTYISLEKLAQQMLTDKICLSQEFYRATEIKSMSTRQQHVYFCYEKQKSLKDLTMKSDEKEQCMPWP